MLSVNLTTLATQAAQFMGGVIDSGESLSNPQLSDFLTTANNLLDGWSNDNLMIPQALVTSQTLSSATQSYTIGSGQTWNMTRPVAIYAASLINSAGPGSSLKIVTAAEWETIADRQAQSYAVKYLFYDRNGALSGSSGKVYVSPIPLGSGLSVELMTWIPLNQFADTTTTIVIPPAYSRLISLALCIEQAPQYDKNPPPIVLQNYQSALAEVRSLNAGLWGGEPSPAAPTPGQER